jgi:hypothetical protein
MVQIFTIEHGPITCQLHRSERPVHHNEQVATILGIRNDGGVYSGVISYAASDPVDVQVWHAVGGGHYAISTISGAPIHGMLGSSGSIPFTGSALVIHSSSLSNSFDVTYIVSAVALLSTGK